MNKEETIQKYMASLKISRAEAEQLFEDDAEDFIGEEGEEMTAKAKKNGTIEREVKKKRPPRERKVDAEKGYILNCIKGLVEQIGGVDTSVKTETELSFVYNDNKYTLKLTKHRPPKGVEK